MTGTPPRAEGEGWDGCFMEVTKQERGKRTGYQMGGYYEIEWPVNLADGG